MFLESELFGTNATRDALDANNDRFDTLAETEDLIALNAAWRAACRGSRSRPQTRSRPRSRAAVPPCPIARSECVPHVRTSRGT